MEFRLTYQGPLYAASNNDPHTKHKHEIRRVFHPQLRNLWKTNRNLGRFSVDDFPQHLDPQMVEIGANSRVSYLATQFACHGYNWVPVVTNNAHVWCGIEVLLLTPDAGGVLRSGDLDNRL